MVRPISTPNSAFDSFESVATPLAVSPRLKLEKSNTEKKVTKTLSKTLPFEPNRIYLETLILHMMKQSSNSKNSDLG